jgi:limonene-1,2-epoxide hydrolase
MTDELTEKDPVVARNEKIVRRFLDAWAALDVEGAMACLAPNIVYINQPLEPVVGLANVRRIFQGILDQTKRVEWKLLNVFGHGSTVCTERLSRDWRRLER